MRVTLGDFAHFPFSISNVTTGNPTDADAAPVIEVFERNSVTNLAYNGSLVNISTVGMYSSNVEVTSANGFDVNSYYGVWANSTVNGVIRNEPIGSFRASESVANVVWDEATSAHSGAGTFGKALIDTDVTTGNIQLYVDEIENILKDASTGQVATSNKVDASAANVWLQACDGNQSMAQVMVAVLAFVGGNRAGANTATLTLKRQDGTTNAVLMENVDAFGNTTSITLDL